MKTKRKRGPLWAILAIITTLSAACVDEPEAPALGTLYGPCEQDDDCESDHCLVWGQGGYCTQACNGDRNTCPGLTDDDPDTNVPMFCVDQGKGEWCVPQCLTAEGYPRGYGAVCPIGWVCEWPEGISLENTMRRQETCFPSAETAS